MALRVLIVAGVQADTETSVRGRFLLRAANCATASRMRGP
ncbi:hypothetical protein PAN31108_03355 [Pandoraea anhela]|uniref:Uncharacterized protein n=1 Tax=Pandoraea anhela TaxID=2508295 RepID=A0A5E4WNW6_9BURK|nr:hypothetical protein PAN31108_03355 [Pandoraea anhela]